MSRSYNLTWQPGTKGRAGRWRKKHRGKVYYFPGGRGKTDREAYNAAITAWEAKKTSIDQEVSKCHETASEAAVAEWEQVREWSRRHGDNEWVNKAEHAINALRLYSEHASPRPLSQKLCFSAQFDPKHRYPVLESIGPDFYDLMRKLRVQLPAGSPEELWDKDQQIRRDELAVEERIWNDRLTSMQRSATDSDSSIEHHIQTLLASKRAAMDAGELSQSRVYALDLHITAFGDWFGAQRPVQEITSRVLLDYHQHLLAAISAGTWSAQTAKDRMASVRSFVNWLWQTDAIEQRPRVLDGTQLRISVTTQEIETFTGAELNKLLNEASQRTRLFLLLMLNCGMTQKDISDLLWEEVDWDQRRIIRKRSKARRYPNAPVVNYVLWNETFRLLRKVSTKKKQGRVLTNVSGKPLLQLTVDENGVMKKSDAIRSAYKRLQQKTGIKKQLRSLKKTSASLIRSNSQYASVEQLFLGHSPSSIAHKHYAKAPQELLDKAVVWLGEELGIDHAVPTS